jgi:hypothetical protein
MEATLSRDVGEEIVSNYRAEHDRVAKMLGDQRRECARRVAQFLLDSGATAYQIDGAAAACEEALPEGGS